MRGSMTATPLRSDTSFQKFPHPHPPRREAFASPCARRRGFTRSVSPVRMTNSAKASVWDVIYTPWGSFHSATGARPLGSPLAGQTLNTRFPGQWFQLESALHYNWHRHYDPSLGRYTQPDPLGFVDGPSVYAYARSGPLKYADKDGRNASAGGTIGQTIGALTPIPGGAAAGRILGTVIGAGITYYCTPSDSGSSEQSDTAPPPPIADDDNDCKDRMSEYQIEQCLVNAHQLKIDTLGRRARIARYELCKCRNSEVAVRLIGCKGPTLRTGVMCP
ncbi:MAG: RHS repeat-associated core domain-containing protein [Hyphomicrobium sp.]|nr:RHS repeat-associated core domain-containing protein [Hyphomicrobium sp.]